MRSTFSICRSACLPCQIKSVVAKWGRGKKAKVITEGGNNEERKNAARAASENAVVITAVITASERRHLQF